MTSSRPVETVHPEVEELEGVLVLHVGSRTLVSILFDAREMASAQQAIRKQEGLHPLDSMELHFANFNAGLLTELKKSDRDGETVRVFAAATVELGGRLSGRPCARCMIAATDHRFVGSDKQIGAYKLIEQEPRAFMEELIESLPVKGIWGLLR
jgi:hypothetical protein